MPAVRPDRVHRGGPKPVPVIPRLERYSFVTPDGCWEWTGGRNAAGYGRIRIRGRSLRAHRVCYELLVGPIPDGLQLDHLCRNRACINPEHLEPVTGPENTRRGAQARPRRTHCSNGHELDPEYAGGRACRICRSAHMKAYYVANREERRAANRRAYERRKAREREAQRRTDRPQDGGL